MPSDDKAKVLFSGGGGVRIAVTRTDESLIMTIGTLSLTLSRATAEEILCVLSDALEPDDPLLSLPANPN